MLETVYLWTLETTAQKSSKKYVAGTVCDKHILVLSRRPIGW